MVFILRGRALLVLLTGGYVALLGLWRDRASSVVPETEAVRAGDVVQIRVADFRGAMLADGNNGSSPSGDAAAPDPTNRLFTNGDRGIRVRDRRNGVTLSPVAAARLRILLAGRE